METQELRGPLVLLDPRELWERQAPSDHRSVVTILQPWQTAVNRTMVTSLLFRVQMAHEELRARVVPLDCQDMLETQETQEPTDHQEDQ